MTESNGSSLERIITAEQRIVLFEKWQTQQNGRLQRIEHKVDGLLIGLAGCLLALIANIVAKII